MSNVVIRELLEVQANTIGGATTTAFENTPVPPVDPGSMWQEYFLLPGKTQNPTMGDGFKREVGVFQINVAIPKSTGSQPAVARAETLRAGFKRGTTFVNGNVRVLIPEAPSIGQGIPSGQWYKVPVSIPYQADVN